nr:receptor-type tyrosine-protein phosphatase T-like isoform X2 [Biomphalaria glabrata]
MSYHVFFFLVFVISKISLVVTEVTCDTNWFGPKCQLKCQCRDGCDPQGQCLGTKKCYSDWIDYACQYKLIGYSIKTPKDSNVDNAYLWQDGDDSTCIYNNAIQSILLYWSLNSYFGWIRLVVSDAALVDRFMLYFEDTSDTFTKRLECWRQQFTIVNNRTVYIRCDMNYPVNRIVLKGEGLTSLCTIQVSKGRNLALKQKADQSSTNGTNFASHAVDGNTDSYLDGGSCTLTNNVTDQLPTWTLTLEDPVVVNFFEIYPANYPLRNYIYYSILQTFDKSDAPLLNVTNRYDTVFPNINKTPVKKVLIRATNTTSTTPLLSICELMVFGECPPGKWGLDCRKVCNDLCPENCNEIDGSCPTSCLGYFPPKCKQECPPNKWGLNCRENCREACASSYCNNIDGQCTAGCNGYSDPPFCTQACLPGYYGLNCLSYTSSQNQGSESNSCQSLSCEELQSHCVLEKDKFAFSVPNFFIGLVTGVVAVLIIVTLIVLYRKTCLKRKPIPKTAEDVYEDIATENVTSDSKSQANNTYDRPKPRTEDEPVKRNMASYDDISLKRNDVTPAEYFNVVDVIQKQ